MANYIDGFVFPIPCDGLEIYLQVVEKVAEIWREHGALSYSEFLDDDAGMPGLPVFSDLIQAKEGEVIVFGWVEFESKEMRNVVNEKVASDTRMESLLAPIMSGPKTVFDASRMVWGGFRPLVHSS